MKAAFRGVVKMLPGKKYPQNMRALPIIVKELLREEFNKKNLICYADLMKELEIKQNEAEQQNLWWKPY